VLSPHRGDLRRAPRAAEAPPFRPAVRHDAESRAWLERLASQGAPREEAAQELHRILVRATRSRVRREAGRLELRGEELEDVAREAADDALIAILARLEEFRGASRFTTWACRFALVHASLALRRRRWKRRELPVGGDVVQVFDAAAPGPEEEVEQLDLLHALRHALDEVLTDWQREVFVAVALNGTPVETVACRRGTTPGATYKALHDCRRKLRRYFGLDPPGPATCR
jgi:RNA polymerase sigma-70 factor, ECF subfamily